MASTSFRWSQWSSPTFSTENPPPHGHKGYYNSSKKNSSAATDGHFCRFLALLTWPWARVKTVKISLKTVKFSKFFEKPPNFWKRDPNIFFACGGLFLKPSVKVGGRSKNILGSPLTGYSSTYSNVLIINFKISVILISSLSENGLNYLSVISVMLSNI